MKRKQDKRRRKQRAKIVLNLTQKVLDSLARLAVGKTPPEIVKAHVAYYDTCNTAEQLTLMGIFKKEEDKIMTDIAEFFAEK
jgi:hypothetical protein